MQWGVKLMVLSLNRVSKYISNFKIFFYINILKDFQTSIDLEIFDFFADRQWHKWVKSIMKWHLDFYTFPTLRVYEKWSVKLMVLSLNRVSKLISNFRIFFYINILKDVQLSIDLEVFFFLCRLTVTQMGQNLSWSGI